MTVRLLFVPSMCEHVLSVCLLPEYQQWIWVLLLRLLLSLCMQCVTLLSACHSASHVCMAWEATLV